MGFNQGFQKVMMEKEAFILPAARMIGSALFRAGTSAASGAARLGKSTLTGVGKGAKFVGNTAAKASGMEGPVGAGLTLFGLHNDTKTNYQKAMGGFSR